MAEVNASAAAPESAASNPSDSIQSQNSEQVNGNQSVQAQEAAIDSNPNLSKAEKAEVKKNLKSLKIKYNGKEIEESLPFEIPDNDESREFMTRHLQMSKMGQSKAQEYSQLEKDVKSFIDDLRKNPRKVLSDPTIGLDVKKMAAEIIEEEIANSQKSPEQLAKEKLEQELKSLKEEREKEKEEQKHREFERIQQESFERYDMLIGQALEKSDLPKSPYVVKKMADYMLMGLQNGIEVSPEDILPIIRDEVQSDLKEMFAVMPDEVIEAIIGKDVFNRVRKKQIAKAKESKTPPTAQKAAVDTGNNTSKSDKKAQEKQSFKEFFKF